MIGTGRRAEGIGAPLRLRHPLVRRLDAERFLEQLAHADLGQHRQRPDAKVAQQLVPDVVADRRAEPTLHSTGGFARLPVSPNTRRGSAFSNSMTPGAITALAAYTTPAIARSGPTARQSASPGSIFASRLPSNA